MRATVLYVWEIVLVVLGDLSERASVRRAASAVGLSVLAAAVMLSPVWIGWLVL